jgi:Protein of unknown function (DUF3892)
MANYQITCVIKCNNRNSSAPDFSHAHITDVGVVGLGRLTVKDAYRYIDAGNTFYTVGHPSGKMAIVAKCDCTQCYVSTLRSHSDGRWDNNLDNLGTCV